MSRAKDLRNITATGTASEDNYVLTYDDATKKVSLEASAGGGEPSGDKLTITAATAPADPSGGEAFIYSTQTSGDTGIQIHASGSSEVLRVRSGNSSTNLMYLNNQGNVEFNGYVRASYFEDRNNTSYYADLGATGTSMVVAGNVGIGTTSPATSYGRVLQIHDTGTSGANLRLTDATSGAGTGNGMELIQLGVDSYIINRELGDMSFYTGGMERITMHADGHLGLSFATETYRDQWLSSY